MPERIARDAPEPSGAREGARGAPRTLVLVPTELELRRLLDLGGFGEGAAVCELCGFGPVAAAARTAQLVAALRPESVLLVGIAGAYDAQRDPVGTALEFTSVAIDGIGVGEGRDFLAPAALGFPQWPARGAGPEVTHPIFDRLELAAPPQPEAVLLTTCSASADPSQARIRRERFPAARAEDMEGFAVATACALARVELRIVRGFSNLAGDRAPERWNIPRALHAARELALAALAAPRTRGPAPGRPGPPARSGPT